MKTSYIMKERWILNKRCIGCKYWMNYRCSLDNSVRLSTEEACKNFTPISAREAIINRDVVFPDKKEE